MDEKKEPQTVESRLNELDSLWEQYDSTEDAEEKLDLLGKIFEIRKGLAKEQILSLDWTERKWFKKAINILGLRAFGNALNIPPDRKDDEYIVRPGKEGEQLALYTTPTNPKKKKENPSNQSKRYEEDLGNLEIPEANLSSDEREENYLIEILWPEATTPEEKEEVLIRLFKARKRLAGNKENEPTKEELKKLEEELKKETERMAEEDKVREEIIREDTEKKEAKEFQKKGQDPSWEEYKKQEEKSDEWRDKRDEGEER